MNKKVRILSLLLSLLLMLSCVTGCGSEQEAVTDETGGDANTIFSVGSEWKYSDKRSANWQNADFDDSAWKSGKASFGYGTLKLEEEVTCTTEINAHFLFLRKSFTIEDPASFNYLVAELYMDDGVTIYINGQEAGKCNEGATQNNGTHPDYLCMNIDKSLLKAGENTIAVYLVDAGGDDMYFDMSLLKSEEFFTEAEGKATISPGKDNTELNFNWFTEADVEKGYVEWAKADDIGDKSAFSSDKARSFSSDTEEFPIKDYRVCNLTVDKVEENTEYFYRYGDGENWSEVCTFKTGRFNDFKAIVLADPQVDVNKEGVDHPDAVAFRNTVTTAFKTMPDASLVISAGDQSEGSISRQGMMQDYTAFLSPEEFSSIPVSTIAGNHENYYENDFYTYRFNNPNLTENGKHYAGSDYYYKFGNTLFIALHCGDQYTQTSAEEHNKTMEEAIKAYPDVKWKVVIMHFDIYGVGTGHSQQEYMLTLRPKMAKYIDQNDIDMVISGHDHVYSRTYFLKNDENEDNEQMYEILDKQAKDGVVENPDGTVYITVSTASGCKYYDLVDPIPDYAEFWMQEYKPMYNTLEVTDDSLTIKAYMAEDGKEVDSLTIQK